MTEKVKLTDGSEKTVTWFWLEERLATFYRSTFALYEALHGYRNNDKEAFDSGMEQYI